MSAPYYQPVGYQSPPPPPRRRGCCAFGCITLVILLVVGIVAVGGACWYAYTDTVRPFMAPAPTPVHAYKPDPARYADLTNRFQKFMGALQAGHAATLALSADDLNTAVAYAPGAEKLRGRMYFELVGDELRFETNYPVPANDQPGAPTAHYLNARVHATASFLAGDFTFHLRKVETLDGHTTPWIIAATLNSPRASDGASAAISDKFNAGFHGQLERDPQAAAVFNRLRSMEVQNGHLVLTTAEGPPLSIP